MNISRHFAKSATHKSKQGGCTQQERWRRWISSSRKNESNLAERYHRMAIQWLRRCASVGRLQELGRINIVTDALESKTPQCEG